MQQFATNFLELVHSVAFSRVRVWNMFCTKIIIIIIIIFCSVIKIKYIV